MYAFKGATLAEVRGNQGRKWQVLGAHRNTLSEICGRPKSKRKNSFDCANLDAGTNTDQHLIKFQNFTLKATF